MYRGWCDVQELVFDSVKKSVKGRVPAGWRGPGAFGTE